jgi:hypothetical protein
MRVLVCLVGEQPAPNVLPLEYYQPDRVVMVCTDRTTIIAERTAKIIEADYDIDVVTPLCVTPPYKISEIQKVLKAYIETHTTEKDDLVFNLTGATKPMVISAYEYAKSKSARAFYYQSQANTSLIHPYRFSEGKLTFDEPVPIGSSLNIDQFLKLYLGDYKTKKRYEKNLFEENVIDALRSLQGDFEMLPRVCPSNMPNVEIDFVLRYRNTIAVGEIKETA